MGKFSVPGVVPSSQTPAALFGIKLPGIGDIVRKVAGALPIPGAGAISQLIPRGGRSLAPSTSCIPPFFFNPATGKCDLDLIPGPGGGGTGPIRDDFGGAAQGRFGVGLAPASRTVTRRSCPRGAKLGKDGLCYDKIANKDRAWPRGARPLLTGGDMKAISKASRAAARLERTSKRLQKIGLIKKPSRGRARPRRQIAAPNGVHVVNVE